MRDSCASGRGLSFTFEGLEGRQLLAASDMPGLVGLNALRTSYPSLRGQGQVVAVLDSGVNGINYNTTGNAIFGATNFAHVDFAGTTWRNPHSSEVLDHIDNDGDGLVDNVNGYNFSADQNPNWLGGTADLRGRPVDDNGHGTAVSGIIVAKPHGVYQGVAPDAKILPLKIVKYEPDASGKIIDHWVDAATLNKVFAWLYKYAAEYNIVSVNMSWGFYGASRGVRFPGDRTDGSPSLADYSTYKDSTGRSIQDYVHLLWNQGVVIAQAVGNSDGSVSGVMPLGEYNATNRWNGLGVGSLDAEGDGVWGDDGGVVNPEHGTSYSTDPNFIDILAPGYNNVARNDINSYFNQDGPTSFATPWIAGAAALLKQVNPNLGQWDIVNILKGSSLVSINDTRSGQSDKRLDLKRAVDAAMALPPAAQDNDILYDASRNVHMAWYDASSHTLKYAMRPVGSPTFGATEVIDTGAAPPGGIVSSDVGRFVDLQISNGLAMAVAYYDATNGDLRYAIRTAPGIWTVTQIVDADNVGQFPSLQFNSSDRPWITHYDATTKDLKITNYMGGGAWGTNVIDAADDSGKYAKLAKGGNGFSTAYVTRKADGTSEVKTSYQDSGGVWHPWVTATAAGEVRYIDFSGGYNTQPWHLGFFDAAAQKVIIHNSPGVGPYLPQSISIGADIGSLAFDASGRIVYYNRDTNQLIQGSTVIVNGGGRYANMATRTIPHLGSPSEYFDTLVYLDPVGTSLLVSPEQVY